MTITPNPYHTLGPIDTGETSGFAQLDRYADKTFHAMADAWGGSTLTIYGTNEMTTAGAPDWTHEVALFDIKTQDTAAYTADAIGILLDAPVFIRIKVAGGTGTGLRIIGNMFK